MDGVLQACLDFQHSASFLLMVCLQQEEVSEELLNFHQVMNKMQEMEEEVQDDHKAVTDVSRFA